MTLLRQRVADLLPRVDLPEAILEVQEWTGFASEFTHVSEGNARVEDLPMSICAALLAEACNIGLEPLVRRDSPALKRNRLAWVQQNYIRAETLAQANARLVDYHARLSLSQAWGGGEVASADGLRFVVPVRTINAASNSKYFGVGRGVTYYNFTSDQFTGFHGIVIPGTLRDSLYIMHPQSIAPVPEDTARVARAAFPKGNMYMKMRDELGTIYHDQQFASLFPTRGQPAEAPWRLALVCVFQFIEGLSDRQAADAVRSRIDWKYALGLELTAPGFDFSVLSGFRARLISGELEEVLLDTVLAQFKQQSWLKERGSHRTDSTHVLAAVRVLNRLETVGETLRAALNAPAAVAPDWLQEQVESEDRGRR